jgi:hypothetical protein
MIARGRSENYAVTNDFSSSKNVLLIIDRANPEIEISSVDWAQLSRLFFTGGRRQNPVSETLFLIKKLDDGLWQRSIIVSIKKLPVNSYLYTNKNRVCQTKISHTVLNLNIFLAR